jgi:2-polyprenyl-3-methyl-5-hydroxy-6-metoxy-1,4-benzoquinol methylase
MKKQYNSTFLADERVTSGNVDLLDEKFERSLDKYFKKDNSIKPEFIEYINCPNCSEKNGKTFRQKRFIYKRCKRCGMVYAVPRFKREINKEIHSQKIYEDHYKHKVIPSIDYRRNILARRKYEQIMQFFKKPARVIDIGCGLGEVLSVFKENGWDCTGVDFNEFVIDYAKKNFRLKIIKQDIFDMTVQSQYDLVMLWGVIEHVYEPGLLLQKCNSLLSKDGLLLIEVPSADSLLVRYCEVTGEEAYRTFESARHIMLFSQRSLLEMCAKNGFRCEKLLSNGLDISTITRMKNLKLTVDQINMMQKILDVSLQGDLMRGFFRKT